MNLWSIELWPFLIPLGLVLVFSSLQIGLMMLGVSFDFDADADIDLDADLDVDLDLDADLDADLDVDADADVHLGGGHGSLLINVLSPLGLGTVPLSALLQAFGLSWGLTGVAATYGLVTQLGASGAWVMGPAAGVSLVGAWFGTRFLVRLLAPLYVVTGKAESHTDIIGRTGRVTSLRVDAEYGEVCLEINGAPNYVVVRGKGDLLKRDDTVVVVGYDVDAQRPIVSRMEEQLKQATSVEGA